VPVFEVRDQHILVTGSSSGFGRHFARFLAGNGAKVTLAARRADALASVVADIIASGGTAQSVVLDVTLAGRIDGAMRASRRPNLRSTKMNAAGTVSSTPTSRASG
jgi:NADP-dependent 3-hydroxy acid dehydrogenase YdfG